MTCQGKTAKDIELGRNATDHDLDHHGSISTSGVESQDQHGDVRITLESNHEGCLLEYTSSKSVCKLTNDAPLHHEEG